MTINKPLTLLGAQTGVDGRNGGRRAATGATESIVTGGVVGSINTAAFHVLANDVTIDGFTVAGETSQDQQLGAGIVIGPGQSGTHVTDDVIRNNVAGLFLSNASATDAALIQHDYFGNNNNPGVDGGRGIYTDGTITGGTLTNVTIDADLFNNNYGSTGTTTLEAAVAFESTTPGQQSNIAITNNFFQGNGKATLFFNTAGALIQGNTATYTLDHNSGTFRFEGDDSNVTFIYNNVNHNTGPGVAVDSKGVPGDNSRFVVNDNNFVANSSAYAVPMSVVVDFHTYDGTFDARYNYWNAASGPSGEGPGTGDAVGGGSYAAGKTGWQLDGSGGSSLLYRPWATSTVASGPTLPNAPTNLTATAAAPTQVNLAWTDNAPANESAFIVQRSGDGGVTFTQVGTAPPGTPAFTDTAVAAGATYTYRVYAVNSLGSSAFTNLAAATTPAANSVTYLSSLTPTSATAGFGTPQDDTSILGNPITLRGAVYARGIGTHAASTITYALGGGYSTFAADIGIDDETLGQGSVDFQVIGDGTVLYDSGVLTGTSPAAHVALGVAGVQTLQLVANPGVAGVIDYDHADFAGARLTPATAATMPTVPTAPSGLLAAAASASQINLAWTASTGQTAYAVDRSADGGATWATVATPTTTAYVDVGLAANTTYAYRVRATNSAGSSTPSNTASATTGVATVVPTPPAGLTAAVASATEIDLTWTAAMGQTAYAVDRSTDNGVTWVTVATPTTTSYADTGLTPGAYYAYQVRATNALGTSAPSNIVAATTAAPTVPTAPTGLTAVAASSTQINLTWTGSAGQTAYAVDRSTDSGVTWTTVAAPTTTTFTDTGLTPGTFYGYRIRATNAAGTSAPSNTAGATTPAAVTPTPTPTATQLSGTVIGTAGSYNNGGNTIAKAVDGNVTTYFDGPTANGNWVGLDLGAAQTVTQLAYAPRGNYAARMVGGIFQASTTADFSAGVTTLYTVTAAPAAGALTTVTLATPATARYVRYLSPAGSYGDIAEVTFFGPPATATVTPRTGTVIGTPGSYNNAGNTIAKAVDGKLATFFDGPTANGNYVGLDLGSAQTISQISYAPRTGFTGRMVGGTFQASTTADFSVGVTTLYTVAATPTAGLLTTVALSTPVTARYVRYLSPAGGYGNVAEIAFAG